MPVCNSASAYNDNIHCRLILVVGDLRVTGGYLRRLCANLQICNTVSGFGQMGPSVAFTVVYALQTALVVFCSWFVNFRRVCGTLVSRDLSITVKLHAS